MNDLREAAEMALNFLEDGMPADMWGMDENGYQNAITALRQALEHPSDIDAAIKAENEACAKVCEAIYNDPNGNNGDDAYYSRPYLHCAAAIRKRMK